MANDFDFNIDSILEEFSSFSEELINEEQPGNAPQEQKPASEKPVIKEAAAKDDPFAAFMDKVQSDSSPAKPNYDFEKELLGNNTDGVFSSDRKNSSQRGASAPGRASARAPEKSQRAGVRGFADRFRAPETPDDDPFYNLKPTRTVSVKNGSTHIEDRPSHSSEPAGYSRSTEGQARSSVPVSGQQGMSREEAYSRRGEQRSRAQIPGEAAGRYSREPHRGRVSPAGRENEVPRRSRPADRDGQSSRRTRSGAVQEQSPLLKLIGTICSVLAALCLVWVIFNVHPDSGTATEAATERNLDLIGKLNVYMNNAASDAVGDLAYIKKIYTIDESAVVAPAPNESRFGTTTDPAVIQELVDNAQGLLAGQELCWHPDIVLFPGSSYHYYYDETILVISWKEIVEGKCCTFSEVKIAHGSQLRRKISNDSYGSSVYLLPTEMAKQANAVVAINGDFYAYRQMGVTVYQRQLYRCDLNHVDYCFFNGSGDMLMEPADKFSSEDEVQRYLDENDVTFAISFGPILVDNGELRQYDSYPLGEINKTYSRAAIGMLDDLHYLLMTINYEGDCGTTSTVNQEAQFMYNKGCTKAYALDGGQTSTMVMQGKTLNKVDWNNERTMSDIIYFATAIPEGA